jgi:hypothetical protein
VDEAIYAPARTVGGQTVTGPYVYDYLAPDPAIKSKSILQYRTNVNFGAPELDLIANPPESESGGISLALVFVAVGVVVGLNLTNGRRRVA